MIKFKKEKGKDFTILNLTDPHFDISEWSVDGTAYKIYDFTLKELVKRVNPDLITISGDISWGADHYSAYKQFADYMENLGVAWAPIWGNHDDEDGQAVVEEVVDLYRKYKTFFYEEGDRKLGNGNYVIEICEDEKTVEALFMMDTHYTVSETLLDINCNPVNSLSYASLTAEQLDWYKSEVEKLLEKGCKDSTHIFPVTVIGRRFLPQPRRISGQKALLVLKTVIMVSVGKTNISKPVSVLTGMEFAVPIMMTVCFRCFASAHTPKT